MGGFWIFTNYFNLKGIPVDNRGLSYYVYEPALFPILKGLCHSVLDPISLWHMWRSSNFIYYSVFTEGKKKEKSFLFFPRHDINFSKGRHIASYIGLLVFFLISLSPTTTVLFLHFVGTGYCSH